MKTVELRKDLNIYNGIEHSGYYTIPNSFNEDHSGTYVLASEAKAEIDKANAEWIERCRKFRAQDAEEANERNKVLEGEVFEAVKRARETEESLESERDRLKAEVLAEQGFKEQSYAVNKRLRARHAALVKAATGVKNHLVLDGKQNLANILEAALAEVK
jgi:hypothetical protein